MLNVDNGKVSLGAQRAVDDFPELTAPVLPLTAEERALYGDNLGENIRDTNLTPDFPRAAALINAMQKRAFGTDIDGVISVDPVVLSAVLRATGPVKVGDDMFNAHNVVPRLLNQVYKDLPTRAAQDAYFDAAARRHLRRPAHPQRRPAQADASAEQVLGPAPLPGVERPPRRAAADHRDGGER